MSDFCPHCDDFSMDSTRLEKDRKMINKKSIILNVDSSSKNADWIKETRKEKLLLSEREIEVLELRHGLNTRGRNKSLEEVGRELGVTRERIRQIEAKALRKLQSHDLESLDSMLPRLSSIIQWYTHITNESEKEIQELKDSGWDDETIPKILEQRKNQKVTEQMIARIKDHREHPEKYWETGEGGSVTTRIVPVVDYKDLENIDSQAKNWKQYLGNKEVYEGEWDGYRFYVTFYCLDNPEKLFMRVEMLPEQYHPMEVTVHVDNTLHKRIPTGLGNKDFVLNTSPISIPESSASVDQIVGINIADEELPKTVTVKFNNPLMFGTNKYHKFTLVKV